MSGENGHATLAGSRLDWLRARHESLKADRHVDKTVPGYDGRLAVRYGPVPWSIVSKLQTIAAANNPDPTMVGAANTDVVIAACRDVLIREDDDDELHGIDPEGPITFGPELAELIGADATSARAVVEWLFPSEWAVGAHAGELIAWTQAAGREDAEQLAGE
jgi:hypothetical protein